MKPKSTHASIRRFFRRLPVRRRAGTLLILSGGWLAAASVGRADDVVPKAPLAVKYAKMAGHSPFAPPTVPITAQATPPPPPAPGWADSLTATMIAQDGVRYMVTVIDARNSQHLYLTTSPDQATNIAVASVKWGANRNDPPTITLSKGKEFAQVRYETGTGSPGAPNPGGGPPIPGASRYPLSSAMSAGQPFHPPSQPGVTQNPTQMPASMAFHRPLIRSQPPAAPVAPVRPAPNPPNVGVRPNPALQSDDDDDN